MPLSLSSSLALLLVRGVVLGHADFDLFSKGVVEGTELSLRGGVGLESC